MARRTGSQSARFFWRFSRDLDAVGWAKDIRDQLPAQKRGKPLHFSKMDHAQRIMAINGIRRKPIRVTTAIANKPITPADTYFQKNQLYHYMSRYLIERLSWLCRDNRPDVPEGDGRVKIIFARPGGMSTVDFKNYLYLLRNTDDQNIQIHWPVIDIDASKRLISRRASAFSWLTWPYRA